MKVRLPHVLEWMSASDPDVLVLQEIKQVTEVFPSDELAAAGYRSIANGQKTYNGVAVISKEVPGDPDFEIPGLDDPQRRVLATTVGDVRVVDLYVPNGSEVGSEKYAYKLGWLSALRDYLAGQLEQYENLVVLGDFNIAPADQDAFCAARRKGPHCGNCWTWDSATSFAISTSPKRASAGGTIAARAFSATPDCEST